MNGSEDLPESYDYDLIVVGGGSGGLAAAKARLLVCSGMWIEQSRPRQRSPGSLWNLFELLL